MVRAAGATAVAVADPGNGDGGRRVGGGAVAELSRSVRSPSSAGSRQSGRRTCEQLLAATVVAVLIPVTVTGVHESVVVPSPSCP